MWMQQVTNYGQLNDYQNSLKEMYKLEILGIIVC